jgi:hypothetical protein
MPIRVRKIGLPLILTVVVASCGAGGVDTESPSPRLETRSVTEFGDLVVERYTERGAVHHRMLATADATWSALTDAYRDLGMEIGSMNTSTRTVGNMQLSARRTLAGEPLSRFFECGTTPVGAPRTNTHRLEIRIQSRVVAEGAEHSRIESELHAVAYPVGTSTRPADCVSKGTLEDRIASAVVLRLYGR